MFGASPSAFSTAAHHRGDKLALDARPAPGVEFRAEGAMTHEERRKKIELYGKGPEQLVEAL